MADEALTPLPGTVISRQGVDVAAGFAFNRPLMQNLIAGNAMLFNAALCEKAGEIPSDALMHDSWLALVAVAFGHIAFVNEPLYYYRQHGGNVLGTPPDHSAEPAFQAGNLEESSLAGIRMNIKILLLY